MEGSSNDASSVISGNIFSMSSSLISCTIIDETRLGPARLDCLVDTDLRVG